MLPYFKKYTILMYVLPVLAMVVLTTVLAYASGFALSSTLPGLLVSLAGLVVLTLLSSRIFGNLANKKADELVALYNESCDPQAFVEQGAEVASTIEGPYTEAGSWFLSFYALALLDVGQVEPAAVIGSNMQKSAMEAADPRTRAAVMVNIEPLVLRLFGAQAALGVVAEAEAALASLAGPDAEQRRSFLAWERSLLTALVEGDEDRLLQTYSEVRLREVYPMRMRALNADAEAAICRRRGLSERERECLKFVVEHGNQLPIVPAARARLTEL